jgi:histidine kinase
VYLTRILSYGAQDKNALAIATGRQVLIDMGITRLPRRPGTRHVIAELLKTKWALRNHTEQALLALPTLEDARWLQAMSIIDMMQAVAYCSDMNLFAVMNLRMLRWTVRYGVCRFSPTVLATYGVVLCQIGELRTAQLYGASSMDVKGFSSYDYLSDWV